MTSPGPQNRAFPQIKPTNINTPGFICDFHAFTQMNLDPCDVLVCPGFLDRLRSDTLTNRNGISDVLRHVSGFLGAKF